MCFYVVNVQVRIYHKKTKNHANTGKTGTRVEDGQKVKAGIQKSTSVLHYFKIGRISPLKYFGRITNSALGILKFTQLVLVILNLKFQVQIPSPIPKVQSPIHQNLDPACLPDPLLLPGGQNNIIKTNAPLFSPIFPNTQ